MSEAANSPSEGCLGRSTIKGGPLVLGGNVFGWTIDSATSSQVLDAFIDGGGVMIDTADCYSAFVPGNAGGESETIIGDWLPRRPRDQVVIATKTGMRMGDGTEGLAPDRIVRTVEASLRRLKTDHIDLLYAHMDDTSVPLEDVLETFDKLVRTGKVRALGASNYSASRLAEALDISEANNFSRFEVLQPLYNLVERSAFEGELEGVCRERQIGVLPYFGLASGFLTGKYRSLEDAAGSARSAMVQGYLDERGKRVLAAMDAVAAQTGGTLAQIALAWLAGKPQISAPIASATSVEQVENLLGASKLSLDEEMMRQLDAASAP